MAGLTPEDPFFDFKVANANNQAFDVGFYQPNPVYNRPNFSPHQFPHPRSTMGAQLMQQTGPRAAITDPSPAMFAPFAPGMQQQWPAHSLMIQDLGTGQFSHRGPGVPYLPTQQQQQQHRQQQQQVRHQLYTQQHWLAPPPEIQNRGAVHNTYQQPPAQYGYHTELLQRRSSLSKGMISEPHPYTQPQPSASFPSNAQQQYAPFSLNVPDPRLRPDHRPQQLGGFPTGPIHPPGGYTRKPTQEVQTTLSAVQPYQPNANHTPLVMQTQQQPANITTTHHDKTSPFPTPPKTPSPPTNPKTPPKSTTTNNREKTSTKTPTKNSKPEGISKTPGRKPKDHGKTGFINETMSAGVHFNITMYGRSSLRSGARAAEWFNQPVKATKKNKNKNKNRKRSTSKGKADGSKSTTNNNNNKNNNDYGNVVQQVITEPTADPSGAVPVQRAGREEAEDGMVAAVNQEDGSAGPPAVEIIGTPAQGQEQELGLELGMTDFSDVSHVDIQDIQDNELDGMLEGFDFDKA